MRSRRSPDSLARSRPPCGTPSLRRLLPRRGTKRAVAALAAGGALAGGVLTGLPPAGASSLNGRTAAVTTHVDAPAFATHARVTASTGRLVFGQNAAAGTAYLPGGETEAAWTSRVVKTYGSMPVSKMFYSGMLPTTWQANHEGTNPKHRVILCFKPNQAALASGALDTAIRTYIRSIPAGWYVKLVNWQEPDDDVWVSGSFTAAQHAAATNHLADVVHADRANDAGKVEVWDCFQAYSLSLGSGGPGVARWKDDILANRADGVIWDAYGNPTGGTGLSSTYPDPAALVARCKAVMTRNAISNWGFGELGAPRRSWDGTGQGRAAWFSGAFDAIRASGARFAIVFNAVGTSWDQRIVAPPFGPAEPSVAVIARYTAQSS